MAKKFRWNLGKLKLYVGGNAKENPVVLTKWRQVFRHHLCPAMTKNEGEVLLH